jgi:3-oxoacyl-[acyl-carrier-protein] synthase II
MATKKSNETRIVITGFGLTAPNANNLAEFQKSLLTGKSEIQKFNIRYMG